MFDRIMCRTFCALPISLLLFSVPVMGFIGLTGFQAVESLDDLFSKARALAFDGKRNEARAACRTILERNANYYDARVLLGSLYSWDGEYELARKELKQVLAARPGYLDARYALIDVERWSGNPVVALQLCNQGLGASENDEMLLYKRAFLLEKLGDLKDAAATAKKLLVINPTHKEADSLLDRISETRRRYKVTVDYAYEIFDKTFDPWHHLSFSLSRQTAVGKVIGRINYGYRFGQSAAQYEVDAYPRIRQGTYAYLNAGYSSSGIFPKTRFGGEIYQGLPRSFEASIGLRHLRFSTSSVTIYTGSAGKYYGNYWLSFRPYVTPSSIGTSFSAAGTVRRYFEDAENYVTFVAGVGSFPDERNTTLDTYRLKSARFSVDGRKSLGKGLFASAYFGFDTQEIALSRRRNRFSFGTSIEKQF